jgi:hypothetical protein
MNRFIAAACAVGVSCLPAIGPNTVAANDGGAADARALPMQFELWTEGPARTCGDNCSTWVSASGAITADTPRDFQAFASKHKLNGIVVALDSDGGSVLGALALGREIRRAGMITTVGKTIDLASTEAGKRRARLLPRAYCESMCAFVLLAGVERRVPAAARVMVHQIWLGDRRDDPTAANYSAEDLVVVQRDIGRLAQYTVEMGGGINLLETALKIPPWEPMRLLSREELRGMKIVTADDTGVEASSGASASSTALASGARAPVNGRSWAMLASAESPTLGRNHPLTVEGEDIGTFELNFACGETGRAYNVTYIERRRGSEGGAMPAAVTNVGISLSGKSAALKIASSRPNGRPREIDTIASGRLTPEALKAFADAGARSLTVETASDDRSTVIRVGNAGFAHALPRLVASCAGQPRIRNTARNEARQGG